MPAENEIRGLYFPSDGSPALVPLGFLPTQHRKGAPAWEIRARGRMHNLLRTDRNGATAAEQYVLAQARIPVVQQDGRVTIDPRVGRESEMGKDQDAVDRALGIAQLYGLPPGSTALVPLGFLPTLHKRGAPAWEKQARVRMHNLIKTDRNGATAAEQYVLAQARIPVVRQNGKVTIDPRVGREARAPVVPAAGPSFAQPTVEAAGRYGRAQPSDTSPHMTPAVAGHHSHSGRQADGGLSDAAGAAMTYATALSPIAPGPATWNVSVYSGPPEPVPTASAWPWYDPGSSVGFPSDPYADSGHGDYGMADTPQQSAYPADAPAVPAPVPAPAPSGPFGPPGELSVYVFLTERSTAQSTVPGHPIMAGGSAGLYLPEGARTTRNAGAVGTPAQPGLHHHHLMKSRGTSQRR